jgi:hypothetical protein
MVGPSFGVSNSEFSAAFDPAAELFLTPAFTNEIAEQSWAAQINGKDGAYLVPAVDFAIGVGLNVCRLPTVQERMSNEVFHRADAAAFIATLAVDKAVRKNLFIDAYRKSPWLSKYDPRSIPELRDANFLRTLGEPPFMDVAIVAGGALRAIQKRGITEGEQDIIAASSSLEIIAYPHTRFMPGVTSHFGRPYAHIRHYSINTDVSPPTVDLTREAKATVRANTSNESGCAAMKIRLENGDTLFTQRYQEILRYLLAGRAVASYNPPKSVRR